MEGGGGVHEFMHILEFVSSRKYIVSCLHRVPASSVVTDASKL